MCDLRPLKGKEPLRQTKIEGDEYPEIAQRRSWGLGLCTCPNRLIIKLYFQKADPHIYTVTGKFSYLISPEPAGHSACSRLGLCLVKFDRVKQGVSPHTVHIDGVPKYSNWSFLGIVSLGP